MNLFLTARPNRINDKIFEAYLERPLSRIVAFDLFNRLPKRIWSGPYRGSWLSTSSAARAKRIWSDPYRGSWLSTFSIQLPKRFGATPIEDRGGQEVERKFSSIRVASKRNPFFITGPICRSSQDLTGPMTRPLKLIWNDPYRGSWLLTFSAELPKRIWNDPYPGSRLSTFPAARAKRIWSDPYRGSWLSTSSMKYAKRFGIQ